MNVLSVFDGISCGQLALKKVGMNYDKYYSSEINSLAIKITQNHFPNTIQLGDLENWQSWNLPKIDLIMAGIPCQGFSIAGKRKGFKDQRSGLAFIFFDLFKKMNLKYFILENVPMKKDIQNKISEKIGVKPIQINSGCFTAQNRVRLYWINIDVPLIPMNGKKVFNKYLYQLPHGFVKGGIRFYEKYPTLAAQSPGFKYKMITNSGMKTISPEYCEELQSIPIGYTDIVPKTHRYNLIGNGFTVDVIAHILKGIK